MGVFDNIKYMLQAMSKDKLPLNDLNRGGYIKPIDALLGRKPMDYDIMLGGETAREQEYYKRIGALTADTNKAITFGSPRYIEGIDPESAYYMRGDENGPRYENIPSGYSVLKDKIIAPEDEVKKAVLGISALNPGYSQIGDLITDWYTKKGHVKTADRAKTLALKAIEYGIDPYMMSAIGAQEGGWLRYSSSDAPNNYLGLGETDSGSMGMGAASFDEWLDKYLSSTYQKPIYGETPYAKRKSVDEWGGVGGPYKYKYNYNDSWNKNIKSLMRELDTLRQQKYPDVMAPTIGY